MSSATGLRSNSSDPDLSTGIVNQQVPGCDRCRHNTHDHFFLQSRQRLCTSVRDMYVEAYRYTHATPESLTWSGILDLHTDVSEHARALVERELNFMLQAAVHNYHHYFTNLAVDTIEIVTMNQITPRAAVPRRT